MSGGKHTAGPWEATTRQGSWDWLVYSAANPNVEICQPFHDGTEFNEIGEANARLIAAAPDLLAELKRLSLAYVGLLESGRDRIISLGGQCDPVDVMEAGDPSLRSAKAAIAKAEGRAP